MAWPARIKDAGGIRTQFHHMIDIVPTILEAIGVPAPAMVNGIAQKPIEGVSMAYTWDKANATVASHRTTQYFEMFGNRAHLPRRLDRRHNAAGAAVEHGHRQVAGRASTDISGSYTTSRRTIRRTTISRPPIPASCASCRSCSWSRRRSTTSSRWTTRSFSACSRRGRAAPPAAPSSPTRGELIGHSDRRRAEHPQPLVHDHRRRGHPAKGAEGMLVTAGRPLRRIRLLRAQGQAGLHVQLPRHGALPLGGAGVRSAAGSTRSSSTSRTTGRAGKGGTGVFRVDGREVATSRSRTRSRS